MKYFLSLFKLRVAFLASIYASYCFTYSIFGSFSPQIIKIKIAFNKLNGQDNDAVEMHFLSFKIHMPLNCDRY